MPSQSWYGWRAAPGRAGDDDGVIGGDENDAPLTPAQIETIEPMLEQMDKIKPGTRTTPLRQVSAAAWKKLLAHSDEELGIDPEFTRPGIEALLENFDEMLNKDSRGIGVQYPFEWRP